MRMNGLGKKTYESKNDGVIIPAEDSFGFLPRYTTQYNTCCGKTEANGRSHVDRHLVRCLEVSLRNIGPSLKRHFAKVWS